MARALQQTASVSGWLGERAGRSVVDLLTVRAQGDRPTPLAALGRGAASGLLATGVLSLLSRAEPAAAGLVKQLGGAQKKGAPASPPDPNDRGAVQRWQQRSHSPAAFRGGQETGDDQGEGGGSERDTGGYGAVDVSPITPAGALARAAAPGPEGAAAAFAVKLATGLFGRDIRHQGHIAGEAVHFAYGTSWGMLYGLLQGSTHQPPGAAGLLWGVVVWLIGPAWLVPAMKIMRPPTKEPPPRAAAMLFGHLAYGLTVAAVCRALARDAGGLRRARLGVG